MKYITKPFQIWQNMATKTRMTLIIVVGVVLVTLIICAAMTDNLDDLFNLFKSEISKKK